MGIEVHIDMLMNTRPMNGSLRLIWPHIDTRGTCAVACQKVQYQSRVLSQSGVRGSPSRVVLRTDSRYKMSSWCEVPLRLYLRAWLKTGSLMEQTYDQHRAAPEVLRMCHLVPRTVLVSPDCPPGHK